MVAIRHVKIEGMEENDMVIRDEFAGDLTNEAIVYNEEDVVDDNDAMNQPDVYFHKSMRTCANMQTEDVIVWWNSLMLKKCKKIGSVVGLKPNGSLLIVSTIDSCSNVWNQMSKI